LREPIKSEDDPYRERPQSRHRTLGSSYAGGAGGSGQGQGGRQKALPRRKTEKGQGGGVMPETSDHFTIAGCECSTFEDGGRYGLHVRPLSYCRNHDDDIGTGISEEVSSFQAEQERAFYLRIMHFQHRAEEADREIQWMRSTIHKLLTKTGRVRRKSVLALVKSTPA
jgi:hypothetical protein